MSKYTSLKLKLVLTLLRLLLLECSKYLLNAMNCNCNCNRAAAIAQWIRLHYDPAARVLSNQRFMKFILKSTRISVNIKFV